MCGGGGDGTCACRHDMQAFVHTCVCVYVCVCVHARDFLLLCLCVCVCACVTHQTLWGNRGPDDRGVGIIQRVDVVLYRLWSVQVRPEVEKPSLKHKRGQGNTPNVTDVKTHSHCQSQNYDFVFSVCDCWYP